MWLRRPPVFRKVPFLPLSKHATHPVRLPRRARLSRPAIQVLTGFGIAISTRIIHTVLNSDDQVSKTMQRVRFLFGKNAAHVRVGEKVHFVPACSVAVAIGSAMAGSGEAGRATDPVEFYPADFGALCDEMRELRETRLPLTFVPDPVRVVDATPVVIDTLELLARSAPHAFLRFVYAYCLALDHRYFAALARHAAAGDPQFFQFMGEHCLKPWSVERYAKELDLPLRKFNLLFQEKYGMSAKRWLMDRRLLRAREMLSSTALRVIDIAVACGFSNHAHFTDTFRKRFLCNPTQYRAQQIRNIAIHAVAE